MTGAWRSLGRSMLFAVLPVLAVVVTDAEALAALGVPAEAVYVVAALAGAVIRAAWPDLLGPRESG